MPVPSTTTLSLKTRVALSLTLLVVAAIAVVTAVQLRQIRASMVEVLAAQQNTLVTRTADEIDEKFRLRQAALVAVAARLGPVLAPGGQAQPSLAQAGQAQAALEAREPLTTMFDNVFIFGTGGQVLANAPWSADIARLNVGKRAYFNQTLATRAPVISAPYRALTDQRPFVMMTAPILDTTGKVIGILGGATSLERPNFLGNIGNTRVGRTGYFYVMTRGPEAVLVSHPVRSRIMGPSATPEGNPYSAQARAGFTGTVEGVNSSGVPGLMTFGPLRQTDWVLAAMLPAAEAFAPIESAQRRAAGLGAIAALLVGALTWALAWWLLVPLAQLRALVRAARESGGAVELPVHRRDEIGELAAEFNDLARAQRATAEALAANELRLRTITDNLPVLIGYLDHQQRYRFNNRAYQEWFGVTQDDFLGRSLREIFGDEGYAVIADDVLEVYNGYVTNRERELNLRGRKRQVRTTMMPDYGPGNQVRGCYVISYDITEQKASEQRLAFLAHHDALTGLPNRIAFYDRVALAQRRARRSCKPFALMYLDIDKFKLVNDTHGHGIGDSLLKAFSKRLTECVRNTDVVGRLGGDEFVILAEDLAAPEDAAAIAAKVVAAMRTPFVFPEVSINASTSIGVALLTERHADLDCAELLERADAALYVAKKGGRNTYRIADDAEALLL